MESQLDLAGWNKFCNILLYFKLSTLLTPWHIVVFHPPFFQHLEIKGDLSCRWELSNNSHRKTNPIQNDILHLFEIHCNGLSGRLSPSKFVAYDKN